jgi:hypothetical protein
MGAVQVDIDWSSIRGKVKKKNMSFSDVSQEWRSKTELIETDAAFGIKSN